MSKFESIDDQFSDVLIECHKELNEMKTKFKGLTDCLKTSELINKHLSKCNESLVAIIEKCRIDYKNNNEIIVLINAIKEEEKCIEREKENLRTFRDKKALDLNERKVFALLQTLRQLKPSSPSVEDKCIQTSNEEFLSEVQNSLDENSEQNIEKMDSMNENNFNSIVSQLCVDFNHKNESESHMKCNDLSNAFTENDSKSDVLSDEHSICSSGVNQSDDNSDSDFELSPKKSKKRKDNKTKAKEKNALKYLNRRKRMDQMVLKLKIGSQYMCDRTDCAFKSTNKKTFYRHVRAHEPIPPDLATEENICDQKSDRIDGTVVQRKANNQYVCNEIDCQFISNTKRDFEIHSQIHRKPRPRALKSTPENPRPFLCDWPGCENTYKRVTHLKAHRLRHMDIRPYECDWPGCGFKLSTSHHYKMHRRTHTKERPWRCDWPGCEYRGSVQWALIAHKRRHTGEKPYACPWPDCNYRCSQPCGLTQHKRRHTGEKPYVCPVKGCEKRFSALAGLHMHRASHVDRPDKYKRKKSVQQLDSKEDKDF